MGIMRKTTSLMTLGVVPYRDKQERALRYAKQTRNAARAQVLQNEVMMDNQRQQQAALDHANVREEVRDLQPPPPAMPPAGWVVDPQDDSSLRWWDGQQWTEYRAPRGG